MRADASEILRTQQVLLYSTLLTAAGVKAAFKRTSYTPNSLKYSTLYCFNASFDNLKWYSFVENTLLIVVRGKTGQVAIKTLK